MNILTICIIAFSLVITTLGIMAVVMRLISMAFPERSAEAPVFEPALVNALGQAAGGYLPGAKVTIIEELTKKNK